MLRGQKWGYVGSGPWQPPSVHITSGSVAFRKLLSCSSPVSKPDREREGNCKQQQKRCKRCRKWKKQWLLSYTDRNKHRPLTTSDTLIMTNVLPQQQQQQNAHTSVSSRCAFAKVPHMQSAVACTAGVGTESDNLVRESSQISVSCQNYPTGTLRNCPLSTDIFSGPTTITSGACTWLRLGMPDHSVAEGAADSPSDSDVILQSLI